jgi:hypothetical protein
MEMFPFQVKVSSPTIKKFLLMSRGLHAALLDRKTSGAEDFVDF